MFMSDISIIVRKMRLFAEASAPGHDIGFPEQLVLMYLSAHGASNQESIAEKLEIDKGAIAKTVGKLEAKGYVRREVNPTNRREKLVELLPKSQAVLEDMKVAQAQIEETMFAGLSSEAVNTTCESLAIIAHNLVKAEGTIAHEDAR